MLKYVWSICGVCDNESFVRVNVETRFVIFSSFQFVWSDYLTQLWKFQEGETISIFKMYGKQVCSSNYYSWRVIFAQSIFSSSIAEHFDFNHCRFFFSPFKRVPHGWSNGRKYTMDWVIMRLSSYFNLICTVLKQSFMLTMNKHEKQFSN